MVSIESLSWSAPPHGFHVIDTLNSSHHYTFGILGLNPVALWLVSAIDKRVTAEQTKSHSSFPKAGRRKEFYFSCNESGLPFTMTLLI